MIPPYFWKPVAGQSGSNMYNKCRHCNSLWTKIKTLSYFLPRGDPGSLAHTPHENRTSKTLIKSRIDSVDGWPAALRTSKSTSGFFSHPLR